MRIEGLNREFITIGENLHTTRVVLRGGKLVGRCPEGCEAVRYTATDGSTRWLPIPETFKRTQDYEEGRIKHIRIAVEAAMAGAAEGREYIAALVQRQARAGADYLDLNVDEIDMRLEKQKAAIRWLVQTVEGISPVPLSVDSSNTEIIQAGLEECNGRCGRPLLNSASLERLDALDVAKARHLPVIVTAAGERGMPENDEQRVANASRVIDAALARGLPLADIHVDALVFPISVDGQFGQHCLNAVRSLRSRWGPELHITGGFSNVSFGLPCRRLLNDVFLKLAVEAGADSGIVDPVNVDVRGIWTLDTNTPRYRLAEDVLLGRDRHCKAFLKAYRKGELQASAAG